MLNGYKKKTFSEIHTNNMHSEAIYGLVSFLRIPSHIKLILCISLSVLSQRRKQGSECFDL